MPTIWLGKETMQCIAPRPMVQSSILVFWYCIVHWPYFVLKFGKPLSFFSCTSLNYCCIIQTFFSSFDASCELLYLWVLLLLWHSAVHPQAQMHLHTNHVVGQRSDAMHCAQARGPIHAAAHLSYSAVASLIAVFCIVMLFLCLL